MLVDYVKSSFIDMSAENLMIPWIYLCYNKEFSSHANSPTEDEARQLQSLNSSRPVGNSTNVNRSGAGLLNANMTIG